jgi:Na+/H+ antiporter NhaC
MPKKKQEEFSITTSVIMLLAGFACFMGVFVCTKDTPEQAKPTAETQKMTEKEMQDATAIFGVAFTVGRTMAKSGAIEPTDAEIDAMSRATQTKLRDAHPRLWFKQHFQAGFWSGWESQ